MIFVLEMLLIEYTHSNSVHKKYLHSLSKHVKMLPLSDEIIIKNSTDMNAICRREMKKEAEKRRFATSFSMQKCLENCKIGADHV